MNRLWDSCPKWARVPLIVAVPIIVCLSIAGWIVVSSIFHVGQGTLTDTKTLEKGTGLSLPKDTRILGGSYDFGPTVVYVVAKVAMPKASTTAFFQNAGFEPFTRDESSMASVFTEERKKRGWSLGTSQNSLYAIKTFPGLDMTANVYSAVDLSDPQMAVVYLFRWY